MPEFQTVAKIGDIPEGEGRSYQVSERLVGVFLVNGEYSAINDVCLHMGASLATGTVENGAVFCPWHGWKFCVKEGTWLDNLRSGIAQDTFEVRIVGDEIQVAIPETPQEAAADA